MARTPQIDPKTGLMSFSKQEPIKAPAPIKNSLFDGARVNRLSADWITENASYDALIEPDLCRLRARSTSLINNDGYAAAALQNTIVNLLGEGGFKLKLHAKNLRGGEDKKASDFIEDAWRKFCRSTDYSVTGDLNEHGFDRLLIKSLFETGDAIQRIVRGFPGNKHRFALQGIPTAHLDPQFSDRQRNIVMSVQKDEFDRPLAYYLSENQPNEVLGYGSTSSQGPKKRFEADQIIHAYLKNEFGSSQGQPWLAPAIVRLRQLLKYEEATLVAARMGASKMGFFVTDYESGGYEGEGTNGMGDIKLDMSAGSFETLPAGVKPELIDPANPNSNHEVFKKAIMQAVAAGLPSSYAAITGDLESVNYSSIRAGTLTERDVWRSLQRWYSDTVKKPTFLAWLEWMLMTGETPYRISDFDRLTARVDFMGRRWSWIDPARDAAGEKMRLEMGLTSRQELLREQGKDVEKVFEEIKQDQDTANALQLELFPQEAAKEPQQKNENEENGSKQGK